MNHSLYFLSDPRLPGVMQYIGKTSVSPLQRVRGHISQARWRVKNDITLPKVLEWILQLQAEGLKPDFHVIGCYPEAVAARLEEDLVMALPELLNDRRPQSFRGGKRPGTIDTAQGKANKSAAGKRPDTIRARSAGNKAYTELWRKEQGFPHPDKPVLHPLNKKHYYALRNGEPLVKAFCRKKRQWRHEMKFPQPDMWVGHRENRFHVPALTYEEWLVTVTK